MRKESVIMTAPDPKVVGKQAATRGLQDEITKLKGLVKAAGQEVKEAQRVEQDLKNELLGLETRLKSLKAKPATGA